MNNPMRRLFYFLASVFLLTGCAHLAGQRPAAALNAQQEKAGVAPFSANPPQGLPAGWEPLILMRTKKETQYSLMLDHGQTVLHAKAVASSSGMMQKLSIDPAQHPWLEWRWKVASLIKSADNFQAASEDSPARIVLAFDGNKDTLPFSDQIMFETAKVLTGRDIPYATLMYIWENKAPVGTIIANTRSKRFQKLVVESGPDQVGKWVHFTRNIVQDYEKAFGEKPGKLIGVGVLTDTDNTGETVEAWYGDIHLLPAFAVN